MSGYRRFIAYVYEYREGRKGEGRGFIKVEARNGTCRMRCKLTGIYEKLARQYMDMCGEIEAIVQAFFWETAIWQENG